MAEDHECSGATPSSLFCAECGHVIDRDSLKTIRFNGASMRVREFFETGDPEVLKR